MTFLRTRDVRIIRAILTEPRIYPWMGDDFTPPAKQFRVNPDERIWYVLVRLDDYLTGLGGIIGLFAFVPDNTICWQAHVAMLPKVPPRITHQAGRQIVNWIFSNTPCCRIIASIPAYNRAAIRFGLQVMGLTGYGVNESSFQRHGRLWDQILLGRSK